MEKLILNKGYYQMPKAIQVLLKNNLDNVNTELAARKQQNKELNDGWNNELMLLSQAESALGKAEQEDDQKQQYIDRTQIILQYLLILFVMRGFFAITRAFIAPVAKQTFHFSSQQSKIQTRIVINQINQLIRLSSTMSGLRIANQYNLSLFSLLEDAQDDLTDLENKQMGLQLKCTVSI
ncbi:unnamed protein product [Paramecium octaurelia]|uniref:Uncharacterized protein n=1 Tax=Paramecium octaurelia TaxID=43137 RepID=A0A8S1XH19_PAROT|nr:unnamed protein product [Paramecium octaurelia]